MCKMVLRKENLIEAFLKINPTGAMWFDNSRCNVCYKEGGKVYSYSYNTNLEILADKLKMDVKSYLTDNNIYNRDTLKRIEEIKKEAVNIKIRVNQLKQLDKDQEIEDEFGFGFINTLEEEIQELKRKYEELRNEYNRLNQRIRG